MRVSQLSRLSGVPVTALKYYVREGLLPEGRRRSGNQTEYDETHVQRVRLVRALLETGGLSIAAAKRVLAVLDDEHAQLAHAFEAAQHAMGGGRATEAPSEAARERIGTLAERRGWRITAENPGLDVAARVLDDLDAVGFEAPDDYLDTYAQAAGSVAHADLAALRDRPSPEAVAELMVVGTVVGDALFAGLRRLAHQEATADLFGWRADDPRQATPSTTGTDSDQGAS
jgi:DNA-binding transcriptional MerR regulator